MFFLILQMLLCPERDLDFVVIPSLTIFLVVARAAISLLKPLIPFLVYFLGYLKEIHKPDHYVQIVHFQEFTIPEGRRYSPYAYIPRE